MDSGLSGVEQLGADSAWGFHGNKDVFRAALAPSRGSVPGAREAIVPVVVGATSIITEEMSTVTEKN